MKILNFGSLNLDYVYQVSYFVQPGETLSASAQTVNPGGKGLNQSVALARAGADTFHAGCVGIGSEMLVKVLKENGVDVSNIVSVDKIQGNAVIQVDRNGQNCILLFGGSNQCVTEKQIGNTLENFDEGDYLLLQNEINNIPLIANRAAGKGMKIVLNPSPYNEKLNEVDFSKLDWLVVNEVEMEQLSGTDSFEKAWVQLHNRYPKISLLVTLGEQGSIAFTERETVFQQTMKVKAVDCKVICFEYHKDDEIPMDVMAVCALAPDGTEFLQLYAEKMNDDIQEQFGSICDSIQVVADENTIYSVEIEEHDETPGIGTVAIDILPSTIVDNQTVDVDSVAGATMTSVAIKEAVVKALESGGIDTIKFGA